MNVQSLERVDIDEQTFCLDKLDEEIDRAIKELDLLNNNTMNQAKSLSQKTYKDTLPSSSPAFVLNTTKSTNKLISEPYETHESRNSFKNMNQIYLQRSPEIFTTEGDPLRELEYSSAEDDADPSQRKNFTEQGEILVAKIPYNPFISYDQNMNYQKKKTEEIQNKTSTAQTRSSSISTISSKENIFKSVSPHKEAPKKSTYSRKPFSNVMQYQKFSNVDKLHERINSLSKSPKASSKPTKISKEETSIKLQENSSIEAKVANRLLQYTREREVKTRTTQNKITEIIQKEAAKKAIAKPPKGKPNPSSFAVSRDEKDSFYDNSIPTSKPSETVTTSTVFEDSPGIQTPSSFHILSKKSSLQPSEINPQRFSMSISQLEEKSYSAGLKNKIDPFYELYKEGYGDLTVTKTISEGYLNENKNTRQSIPQSKFAPPSSSSHEVNLFNKRCSEDLTSKNPLKTPPIGINKYQNVESRYLTGNKDGSKSPGRKSVTLEPKPVFRPQLSKKSLEIAAKLGNSFQRLIDADGNKSKENKKKLLKEMESELTFKPKINKVSEVLDEQFKANLFNGDELHRWDQLFLMQEKYNLEREARKIEREKQLMEKEQCSFQPQLNSTSSRIYRDTSVDFAKRACAWKEIKEKRLDKERRALFDKEIEDCTFQPALLTSTSRMGTSRSALDLSDISQRSIKGLDQHFEKIDRANRMKKELEISKQGKYTGRGWKRQTTVPKEFQLTKRSSSVKPYSHQHSISNVDLLTEEKINIDSSFFEKGRRSVSPFSTMTKKSCNESWTNYPANYDNFQDAVLKLQQELQKMEI